MLFPVSNRKPSRQWTTFKMALRPLGQTQPPAILTHLMNTQAELIDWLHDVHAIEKAKEVALQKLASHPHNHQALREEATRHGTETRRQAEAVVTCLKRLGSDPSVLKTMPDRRMDADLMKSTGMTFGGDERIKDVLSILVTEHLQIARHTVLRKGAARLGLLDLVSTCDQIIDDEKRMAKWLQVNLPEIIATYLTPDEADDGPQECGPTERDHTVHWEFAQLAQNASLFGGPLPRSIFASMRNSCSR